MRTLALTVLLSVLACGAQAQMRVQEYPLPRGITAHDLWADPAPDGPVWFSGQGSGNVRQIHGRKGEVWTPESASRKLVVYRYP